MLARVASFAIVGVESRRVWVEADVRGSGLAVVTTATNLARFLASVGFGALWTFAGLNTAVLVCAIALALAVVVTALVLRASRPEPAGA